jgi:hypothetical protein
MQIRTATEADASAIARLHLSSYRTAYRGLLPDGVLAAYDPAEREHRWLERLNDPSRTTFVTTPALVAFALLRGRRLDVHRRNPPPSPPRHRRPRTPLPPRIGP